MSTRLLGIETSCDETAIGIVDDGITVRANTVASSQAFHSRYGGVVPEIAARVHVEVIWQVLDDALREAGVELSSIDAIAVTQGPGLPGALHIGLAFAKGLALAIDRPLLGVDHLAAHLYAGKMAKPDTDFPYIGLVVSGGHTLLCVAHSEGRFEVLGQTRDDAVGEAFDKVAKVLGLGYPGGPVIDRLSEQGRRDAVAFPRAASKDALDFSFSGLKTAVYTHARKQALDPSAVANIAASFQETAVDMLLTRTWKAVQRTGIRRVVVGGGVAANRRLRERIVEEAVSRHAEVIIPPVSLCVDNGAMVAGIGYELLRKGARSPLSLNADPGLRLAA